ncbi:uncharacterized protein BDZ99DRAFT_459994 [Mytilinidion resinicola]|uniref:Chaperone/heat shock protein Hsp12 n=1 Tax=Mytilinidion resinicola TaxID=574789 RepID=A0A6A6YZF6_9PEZI|nr:uncharacterized protein BDZ99DRAFT_459994 [Mytilinidion resinicola]KAF2814302.1 hypothetical protein BDZ99DRAFT_459994 [Mytilinidion resinicola]
MSDFARKDFSTKAEEKLTPNSTKSTGEKIKEAITGSGDKIARGVQPDSSKSDSQEISDKFGRSKDRNVHGSTGESIVDKTKHALGADRH